ncbi:MAG TPA: biotin/lipoyl-binding protein, partial [Epsilonproteobacteria bacterium]|nr:biotin/lipoyl-binding protein [Campylobacterota bacterium]
MKNIKVQRMNPLLLILTTTLTFLFTACSQPETGYQGYIDVDYTNLSTQSSGTITAIHTEKGTEVQKGDRLIQLDDTKERLVIQELEAQLEGAKNLLADRQEGARLQEREIIEAQLAEASAALKNATDEYARYQALYEKQTVSPSVYEAKELIYKTAQGRVDAVNHQLELARQGSRSYRIKAQEAAIT